MINTNLPKGSGYYWRIGPNFNDEVVTQIVEVAPIISTAPEELFYREPGEIGSVYIKEEPGVGWYGPILFEQSTYFIRLNAAIEEVVANIRNALETTRRPEEVVDLQAQNVEEEQTKV